MNSANYGKPKAFVLLVLSAILTIQMSAQRMPFRITFVDKGIEAFQPGSELYAATLTEFHPDALQRRQLLGKSPILDSLDQPLASVYVDELEQLGIQPYIKIRWRNCVIAELDTIQLNRVRELPFVARVVSTSQADYAPQILSCKPARPGNSLGPHQLLNTLPLLDVGVSGKGASVCLIDNGFRIGGMSSLQHLDVRATYDVIYNDNDVGNAPGEPGNQDGHGSLVLSVAAGWEQDSLIGIAPFATYLLAKSEDMRYERRVEEDNYTAAVEWAERNGADVISSSLGYFGYDDGDDSLFYSDLDGSTTFAAKAINRAVQLGVVCITAAGNTGPRPQSLGIPADTDSVIAVGGATYPGRTPYFFTSQGPTADGRQKPDVAAMGQSVLGQGLDGIYGRASGTSLAAPQIAGSVALLRQLYPDVPAWELRSALYASSTIADSIGTFLGSGIPDVLVSSQILGETFGAGIGPPSVVEVDGTPRVLFGVFAESFPQAELQLRGMDERLQASVIGGLWHGVDVPESLVTQDTLWGRLHTSHNGVARSFPQGDQWFPIPKKGSLIPCGVRLPGSIVSVSNLRTASIGPQLRIAPTPTPQGRRNVELLGLREVDTITLFETSTGIVIGEVAWNRGADGRILIQLPDLSAAAYRIVAQTSTHRVSIPLLVF